MENLFDEWFDDLDLPEQTIRDIACAAYWKGRGDQAREHPKGLPGVTEQQVLEAFREQGTVSWTDRQEIASVLADWFNDPNRDAPVKPTMHPDLEWLARQPVTDFRLNCDRSKVLGFYRKGEVVAAALRPEDGRLWASNNPPVFSLEAIHQARKHLARQKLAQMETERDQAKAERRSIKLERLRQLEAERDAQSGKTLEDALQAVHVMTEDRTMVLLGLNSLPDYETWFEVHGSETAYHKAAPFLRHDLATVHELYTMFRARLLAELHQAGVIGVEGDKS